MVALLVCQTISSGYGRCFCASYVQLVGRFVGLVSYVGLTLSAVRYSKIQLFLYSSYFGM
jgi:hypothetical protein